MLHIVWAPGMVLYPHNHNMWAAIGIYGGREDNTFFRRSREQPGRIEQSTGKTLVEGDVLLLGDDVIHSVENPLGKLTAAIHVYGGDFVEMPRSQWGPGEPIERPFDMDLVREQFAEANARAAQADR